MKRGIILKRIGILLLLLIIFMPQGQAYSPDTLYLGQRGEVVKAMQSGLSFIGFEVATDGVFGKKTQSAVIAFQRQQNLTADGLAGKKTLDTLYKLAPQFKPDGLIAPPVSPVTEKPAPATTKPADEGSQAIGQMVVNTANKGSLNLRSRPSHGNTAIAQIPYGTTVEVLSTKSGWSEIRVSGKTGYVKSSYLRPLQGATPTTKPAQPTQAPAMPTQSPNDTALGKDQAQVVTKNRGSLNMRNRASSAGIVLIQIPYLAKVNVLGKSGSWSKVNYGSYTGYVLSNYLKTGDTPTTKPPENEPVKPIITPKPAQGKAVVNNATGRFLNLRSSPSQNNNIIAQIPSGSVINLYTKGTDWCEVDFNGIKGFVMTSFLSFQSTEEPVKPTQPPKTEEPVDEPDTPDEPQKVFPRVLKAGLKGADVKELQTRLAALKYTVSINAVFDAMTKEAVMDFQKQNSLTADGVFGSQSASVLSGGYARLATDPKLNFKTLRIDNSNTSVTEMQKALKALGYPLSISGKFDIPTHQAVVGFQQRNGLPITGVANPATQAAIFSSNARDYSTKVSGISASEGKGGGPSSSQVKLLHWFDDVKKSASGGQYATIYHKASNSSFKTRFYSMGNHADSEPATWKDTQIMNRAFGTPSWNINTVYVKLPDGRWTLAAMHNRPHLTGAVSANGFGGHLCIHFLRDTAEVNRNDPDYGASNQRAIRKAWQGLTGEVIE